MNENQYVVGDPAGEAITGEAVAELVDFLEGFFFFGSVVSGLKILVLVGRNPGKLSLQKIFKSPISVKFLTVPIDQCLPLLLMQHSKLLEHEVLRMVLHNLK